MMPAWMYSFGLTLTQKAHIKIPFGLLMANLLLTVS